MEGYIMMLLWKHAENVKSMRPNDSKAHKCTSDQEVITAPRYGIAVDVIGGTLERIWQ